MIEVLIDSMKSDDQKYLELVDFLLENLLSEKSRELIRQTGVEYVVKELKKERGRYYVVQRGTIAQTSEEGD